MSFIYELSDEQGIDDIAVTIESYTYDYEGNRISKQVNEEEKVFYLNDTYTSLTQVALELTKNTDNTYKVNKYYTRGLELISADIIGEENNHKTYIQDGHGSVTALVENSKITDTYTYDSYGILLKKNGDTDNDYLYTGEQYNKSTGLYYLRARYMSPETGTFTTMDTYAGTLDNPVSLHKYLYANGNPVMYTDPTGNFSLMETSVAQGIQATINTIITPGFSLQKMLTLANLAVTAYDVATTMRMVFCGEATVLDVALCIVKGLVVQSLISCVSTAVFGEAAAFMLKLVGIGQDTYGLIEAIKSKDPKEIVIATVRLAVSVFTLKSQCFAGDTLVSTEEGNRRIDEIKPGDKVLSYNTETGENEFQEVKNVSVSKTDILVHIITDDGRDIETTMFHPFYVKNEDGTGEWKAASNLKAGDELLSEDGKKVKVSEVKVEKLAEEITVYNLELDEVHTYYVAGGVLVHNGCGKSNTNDSETSYGKSSSNCTELVPYYPANNGAVPGTEKKIYLMAGDKIDRFGGKKGKFFSPTGTPMEMRALPYDADLSQYRQFEVVKPFEVEASTIAPAFGNIGLGTQYRSSVSVDVLLKKGIIKQVGGN